MTFDGMLRKLENLAKKYFRKHRAIDRNGFYECLQQVAEELVSDSGVGLKSKMQGLASCLAVFTRMRLTHMSQHLESANNAIKYLSLECARLLLGVEFVNAKPNDLTISVFCNIMKSCLKQLADDSICCRWFEMLKTLMEDPWNGQQLFSIISGNDLTDKCVSEFIDGVEHPELILLRIEILLGNNCEDMATRLIERFTQAKSRDVHLMSRLLIVLHNTEQYDEFHKQCTNMTCCMACDILRHVHENERMYSQHAAVLLMARTFLILDWTKNTNMTCTRVLLRYWLTLERHHLAEDETEFLLSLDKVIALAHSSTQLITFIDVTESLFGSMYLEPCIEVALRVLRSERHRLDCARLYLKDRMEVKNASRLLACVCSVLARCFDSHRQMKMTCLLSAACLSPSNDHFVSVQDFFTSSSELVSLQPVAPSVVEWKTYMALFDAVKYLQPPCFHSSADWVEISHLLRSLFRRAGWRYDSLAMVFKNNHCKRGIGVVGVCNNLGEIALTSKKLIAATNLEYNALRGNRKNKLTAKRKDLGISNKKTDAVSPSSILKTGKNSQLHKKKANALRKSKKSALPPCKISGKVLERETVSLGEDIEQQKETAIKKQSDGDVIVCKRKRPSTFQDENQKIRRRKEDSHTSLAVKKLCRTKKRLANCKMKSSKSPGTETNVKEAESRDIPDLDGCNNLRVAASPGSSNDSQATILMDNSDSELCNSVPSSSDNLITDTMNCGGDLMTEGKDVNAGNYGHLVDENNDDVDASKEIVEQNAAEQEFQTVVDNQNVVPNSDDWMFQDWSEFGKRAFALEAGESQHGNVDNYVGLECSLNGNSLHSSDLISHSEMCNQREISRDVADSIANVDIDQNILQCHRDKRKEDDENEKFADRRITLEKKDETRDDCKVSVKSASVIASAEVSSVENNQALSGDCSKTLPSSQSSPKDQSSDADCPSRQTFKCSHCSMVSTTLFGVRQHMINIHKVGFACPICLKLIGSRWGRGIHMSRMHGAESLKLYHLKSTDGFKCRICSKSFPSPFGRHIHMTKSHSVHVGDSHEELGVNYSEVDAAKNTGEIHSEAETSVSKPDSQSYAGKRRVINGVKRCSRRPRKYKQDHTTNHRHGDKLFKLESSQTIRVRNRASIAVRLKASRKGLRSYTDLCPKLPLESPTVNGCDLLVEEDSTKASNDSDTPVSVCGVVNSRSSEDAPFHKFHPEKASYDLNVILHETDTPVGDRTIFQNGCTVSTNSLHLKNCYVRLKRLCLSKIKLRDCHVVLEHLSLEQIVDRNSIDVQSVLSDVGVDFYTPLEQQDFQNDISLDSLNSVQQEDVHISSSPAEVPLPLSEPVTYKEVSDGQFTVQNGHAPEVLLSKMLTVDVYSPNTSCKTSSDASLKKSSTDVLPSKMLTVDVCSPNTSCKTSSDASLKKSLTDVLPSKMLTVDVCSPNTSCKTSSDASLKKSSTDVLPSKMLTVDVCSPNTSCKTSSGASLKKSPADVLPSEMLTVDVFGPNTYCKTCSDASLKKFSTDVLPSKMLTVDVFSPNTSCKTSSDASLKKSSTDVLPSKMLTVDVCSPNTSCKTSSGASLKKSPADVLPSEMLTVDVFGPNTSCKTSSDASLKKSSTDVLPSKMLTVDVCSPNTSCKTSSDASLKKSSTDVLPSKMLTVDVCSPNTSCKTSSGASLKKSPADVLPSEMLTVDVFGPNTSCKTCSDASLKKFSTDVLPSKMLTVDVFSPNTSCKTSSDASFKKSSTDVLPSKMLTVDVFSPNTSCKTSSDASLKKSSTDVLPRKMLTVDVCSPNTSCKTSSGASLKKSVADVLPSKMLTIDVCSPNTSGKTSSGAPLKKSPAAAACSAFPSRPSSNLSIPSPVARNSCPTAVSDGQSVSKNAVDTGVSVLDILRSTGSVLFGTLEEMNGDDCLEKLYDSSSSTEVESELVDPMEEMRNLSPCHQLHADLRSARNVNSERRSGLSDATEHVTTDCNKVPRRKLLVKRKRTFSAIEEVREKSKLSSFKSSDRHQDQRSRFGNEVATEVRVLKGKTCKVQLVPLSVLDSGVSNVSNVDNRASDSINKAKAPERKTARKNLFESFAENIVRPGAKKSYDDCSPQPNGLTKHLFDNESRNSGKSLEIIQRLQNQQRICKIQAMKAISISLRETFMLPAPATSGSTKLKDSLTREDTTKSRSCSRLVERIERVAVPVSFSRSGDSLTVVDRQQLSGAVERFAETDASTALCGSAESEDVCVISSDEEEVQVIDLDDADSDSQSSSETEDLRTRQEHAWSAKDRVLANGQRVDDRTSRVRYNSFNNSLTCCDLYCCDLCPKSFTDNNLLMEHRRIVHRQASTGDKMQHNDFQNDRTDKYHHRKSNESLSRSLTERLHRPLESKSSLGRFSFYSSRSAVRHFKPKMFGYRDGQPGFSAQKSLC